MCLLTGTDRRASGPLICTGLHMEEGRVVDGRSRGNSTAHETVDSVSAKRVCVAPVSTGCVYSIAWL